MKYQEYVLGPGEMLFIPRWWWHFVLAIDEASALRWRTVHGVGIGNSRLAEAHSAVDGATSKAPEGCASVSGVTSTVHDDATCAGKKRDFHEIKSETGSSVRGRFAGSERGAEATAAVQYSFSVSFWWGARILA